MAFASRPARGQLGVLGRQDPVGRRLHGDDRGRAADDRQQHRRRQAPRPPAAAGTSSQARSAGADPPRRDRPAVEPGAQVVGQRLGRGVPPPRVLLQALQADRPPGRAAPAALSLRGGSGGRSATCVERLDHAVAAERGPAGQQGVEDRAQAVDVGRRRDRPAPARRLLGGHVGRRAQDGARLASARRRPRPAWPGRSR